MDEYSVIATFLTNPKLFISTEIQEQYFQNDVLAAVWRAGQEIIRENGLVDFLTVQQNIKNNTGQDLTVYLGNLIKNTLPIKTQESLDNAARTMAENYRRREAQRICEELSESIAREGQAGIDRAVTALMGLSKESKKYSYSMKESLRLAIDQIERAWENKGELVGVTTGLEALDNVLSGLQDSDLIVIGARPSMGKTGLLLNMAINSGVHCGVISSEMSAQQLGLRAIALESKIPITALNQAKYTPEQGDKMFAQIGHSLMHKKIEINDKGGIRIDELQRQAREWKQKHDIGALFVDYVQKIKPSKETSNRVDAVGEVAEGLKNIAKELNIPVVALAQVNRSVEQRPDKRPMMSDLKNSGDIEQEADVIFMLYRDEYYNPETPDVGIAELLIEKNRNGPCGMCRVGFDEKIVSFYDLTPCNMQ